MNQTHPHERLNPIATYAPWHSDSEFLACFQKIRSHSLVDVYRCYELWKLVEQVSKLEAGCLVEVGVWRGGSGALIAKQAQRMGLSDPVYLCDTFCGVPKAGPEDDYVGGEHADTSINDVISITNAVGVDNVQILKGVFPDDTGDEIKGPIRFLHVDVDVYRSAEDIILKTWDQIIPGGVVVYDDYGFKGTPGIVKHVDEQALLPGRIVTYNLNGHGIIVKI